MNPNRFAALDRQYGHVIQHQSLTDQEIELAGMLFATASTHYDKMLFFKNNPEYCGMALPALSILRRYETANYHDMNAEEKNSYARAYELLDRTFTELMKNPVVLKRYHHGLTQGVYINTSPLDNINPS
jgi:hypothetical protein